MIEIDVNLEDSFHKKINRSNVERAIEEGLDHSISEAVNTCRREAPIKTGQLRRKTDKHKPSQGVRELINTARSNGEPYWQYVQFGTSKMDANPFVTRTAMQIQPKISKYVKEELDRIMGGL